MNQEESRQKQNPENYPYQSDEINLIDYLWVIWKWKWLIIGGMLACIMVAGIISLQMPKVYSVTMLIKPGVTGLDDVGNYMYMDPAEISTKINEGGYNLQKSFKANVSKYTKLIRISTEFNEKDKDLGLKASRQLIAVLSDDGKKVVQKRNDYYDRKILTKQNDINYIGEHLKLLQARLEIIKKREDVLMQDIKEVRHNMGKNIHQRDIILKNKGAGNDTANAIYSTTIQRDVGQINQFKNNLYQLAVAKNTVEIDIENLIKGIPNIEAEIDLLKLRKGVIDGIKVIQNPEVSPAPAKSKKKQVVFLATVAGLFFFIFLAFFIEYIRKVSKSIRAGD